MGSARATASAPNNSSSAASPCAWTQATRSWRVVAIPVSIGPTRAPSSTPGPFSACVRWSLSVLLVIGGSLVPGGGTVVLADAILTSTLEPSLLSSQIQQRPGHPLADPILFFRYARIADLASSHRLPSI